MNRSIYFAWMLLAAINAVITVIYLNRRTMGIVIANSSISSIIGGGGEEKKNKNEPNKYTKIVGFADYAYRQVATDWFRRLEKLGYTTHVVVTPDEEAAQFFRLHNVTYELLIDPNFTQQQTSFVGCVFNNSTESQSMTNSKKKQTYRRYLFASRWHYISRQLQTRQHHILLTDVDNVFNRYYNMTEELEHSEFDTYHAFEGMVPSFPRNYFYMKGFTLCGGMSWFRSASSVVEFVQHVAERCHCGNLSVIDCDCKCDDQQVLNSIIFDDQSPYKYEWDRNVSKPSSVENLDWNSLTGTCLKTGHRVKVWDRHTTYRGRIDPNKCPYNNWISMPSQDPDKVSLPSKWDAACGNGRGNKTWHLLTTDNNTSPSSSAQEEG